MKLTVGFACLLLSFASNHASAHSLADDDLTLRSVHVVFRHGDRTPQAYPKGFYPNDPHKDASFEPMGYGGLLNLGKRREYDLGRMLRTRYARFLGKTYRAGQVLAVSTDRERTRMSLLLVLAGLYPPRGRQVWREGLYWQPIPVDAFPDDALVYAMPSACPTYNEEMDRVLKSREYKDEVAKFRPLMEELSALTGLEITDVKQIADLYHTLMGERAMELPLPRWTERYFPFGLIKNATLFQYKAKSYSDKLRRLSGGMTIRQILNDALLGREGISKINLYSAHETNVAAMLFALNLWRNATPEYSSGVVFEFHKKLSKFFIRIIYYKGIPSEFETLAIPGCAEFCPLHEFLKIYKDVIPDDVLEACFGPPENSRLIPKNVDPTVWAYEKLGKWFKL